MDLPVFGDNLRSSAGWMDSLDRERESWRKALIESHLQVTRLIREHQVKQAMQRAEHQIDQGRLLDAVIMVSTWADETGRKLDAGHLLEIHSALTGATAGEDALRKTEPLPINAMHDPAPALILPRMLDNAFDWFTTASFNELHPVEQATVVYLRLLDLHPFPSHTETTALLGASFYTERAKLPPLIIFADQATLAKYQYSLDAAFRMLTQPLVEFFAEMLTRTIQT